MKGRPGVANASNIFELVDPRADSVAESVSRLQLTRLGIDLDIQVPVEGLQGRVYWVDFEFLGQNIFGEMDGRSKYELAEQRQSDGGLQSVLFEKAREDEIRGVSGKRIVRWRYGDIAQARRLGERLQAFGVRVPNLE